MENLIQINNQVSYVSKTGRRETTVDVINVKDLGFFLAGGGNTYTFYDEKTYGNYGEIKFHNGKTPNLSFEVKQEKEKEARILANPFFEKKENWIFFDNVKCTCLDYSFL